MSWNYYVIIIFILEHSVFRASWQGRQLEHQGLSPFFFFFFFFFWSFLGLHLRHMEIPRRGVELEL